MERLGHARLFGISNALQMLSVTLERTSYLTRTCFDQGLELAVTGQQVQPQDTLNRHSMALTVQNVLVSMSARSHTPIRTMIGRWTYHDEQGRNEPHVNLAKDPTIMLSAIHGTSPGEIVTTNRFSMAGSSTNGRSCASVTLSLWAESSLDMVKAE